MQNSRAGINYPNRKLNEEQYVDGALPRRACRFVLNNAASEMDGRLPLRIHPGPARPPGARVGEDVPPERELKRDGRTDGRDDIDKR